ncbi:MAG: sulfite exporter TauE/SafE family protein [Zoogloeaceae bacterium]|jgi:sulfite exporter TauE/SafE|nr:sulfite exporter TauE/SafE family protein [Zoogloeaceae bacterium]
MTPDLPILFLAGLANGAHCIGMCGGIVGALSLGGAPRWHLHLAYSLGRITSYVLAGALAGALGAGSLVLAAQWPLRLCFLLIANFMLVLMGLYLMGRTRILTWVERPGQALWRRLSPLTRSFLPVKGVLQAFPLGMLWGWLPCGLVYTALANALSAGSAGEGALKLLAFGLGTLPNLLLAGFLLARFRGWLQKPWPHFCAGSLLLAYGVYGLLGAVRMS